MRADFELRKIKQVIWIPVESAEEIELRDLLLVDEA